MKIILTVRVHLSFPLSSNMNTLKIGNLIKVIKSNFIKAIPNTSLMFENELFFIEEIVQDVDNKVFIFYENITTTETDLEDLKKDFESKGWIWKENLER